jgi:hypothetical protein
LLLHSIGHFILVENLQEQESDEENDEEQETSDDDNILLDNNMSPLNHGAGKESNFCGKLSSFSLWVLFAFADSAALFFFPCISGTPVFVADLEHPSPWGVPQNPCCLAVV